MELKNLKEREKLVMVKDSLYQVEWTATRNERTRRKFSEVDTLNANDLKRDDHRVKRTRSGGDIPSYCEFFGKKSAPYIIIEGNKEEDVIQYNEKKMMLTLMRNPKTTKKMRTMKRYP